MPYSSSAGKSWIGKWLHEIGSVRRVLDIGAGSGRYSDLFRRYTGCAEWMAIEVYEPYAERFELHSKYDVVLIEDVRNIELNKLGVFDVVFCCDVLEHMDIKEAQMLLIALKNQSKVIFASIPIGYCPQGPVYGNSHETHVTCYPTFDSVLLSFPGILASDLSNDGDWTIATFML